MTKLFGAALLCISAFASAQISFAGKANLLFPTNSSSWKSLRQTATGAFNESGKNSSGFNVGLSAKINLPTSFFLMPEVYFTSFKSEVTVPSTVANNNTTTTLKAKNNRIDVPVLLGHNLLGETLGVFIGPVASYNLSKDNTYRDFEENGTKNFKVGYQFGAQAQISKLIINARYEGAFSKDQRNFVNRVTGTEINYDNRPSLFIVGLGYKF